MYCSHCGSATADDLNFCKNCGARNERQQLIVGNSSSRPFAFGAVGIGTVGLVGFFPVLRELLHSQVDPTVMCILLVAYLVTVFLMFAVLVGHVWKNSGDVRIKRAQRSDDDDRAYLPAVNTAQLHEPRDMPASVTEHTTRTLAEIPIGKR